MLINHIVSSSPFTSFTNAPLLLLTVATMYLEKSVIPDPVGAGWATIGADYPAVKPSRPTITMKDRESKMSIDDFLVRDYELRVKFLTDQYQRMWTRFNFFVTIESGYIGGKLIIGNGTLTPELALIGAMLSLAWYIFGAQDSYLVRIYEVHVKNAAVEISGNIKLLDQSYAERWRRLGERDKTIEVIRENDRKVREDKGLQWWKRLNNLEWLSGWHREFMSITRLAAFMIIISVAPLLIVVTLKAVLHWPDKEIEAIVLIGVLLISLLPIVLALVDTIIERGVAVEIAGVKLMSGHIV